MGEGADAVIGHESRHGATVVPAGHSDEGNFVTVFLLHRCDRTGLSDADRSPRRPEPQHDVLSRIVAGVE